MASVGERISTRRGHADVLARLADLPAPERVLEGGRIQAEVEAFKSAVAELRARALIELHDGHGLTYREAGDLTGLDFRTVHKMIGVLRGKAGR